MDAQVVYERDEQLDMHCGEYGFERVGIRIDDRVIWLAHEAYGVAAPSGEYGAKQHEEYQKWKLIATRIAMALREDAANGSKTE